MRSPATLLRRWFELSHPTPLRPIVPGDRVGRGFADLGFEEFLVLDDHRLVSLMTGTVSARRSDENQHLFLLPTVDEAFEIATRGGMDIIEIVCDDNRAWEAVVRYGTLGATEKIRGRTLDEVALEVCRSMKRKRDETTGGK